MSDPPRAGSQDRPRRSGISSYVDTKPPKAEPRARPRPQWLIDGESIYTCSKFVTQKDVGSAENDKEPSELSKPMFKDQGPWFMALEDVLKRRDEKRLRRWERLSKRKLCQLRLKAARARISSKTGQAEEVQDDEGKTKETEEETDEEEDPNRTITQTSPLAKSLSSGMIDEGRRARLANVDGGDSSQCPSETDSAQPLRQTTPDLPSSDLLRSIHHEAMSFYGSHNALILPRLKMGRRPANWQEPFAMERVLDGSALMAIGILLEEIAKDAIAGQG